MSEQLTINLKIDPQLKTQIEQMQALVSGACISHKAELGLS